VLFYNTPRFAFWIVTGRDISILPSSVLTQYNAISTWLQSWRTVVEFDVVHDVFYGTFIKSWTRMACLVRIRRVWHRVHRACFSVLLN